ncbi:hypothetical protein SAMN02745134_02631 [Clostridium acidisoli DSM 12555]|jgi:uncharacterized protein YaaR (DUF327 family)|uniref:DUF327 domain-containing protein n=1 Tax=Clostridium acidisoli DSM 12555 TaxID=1121291 RepID=A0A1W1XR06_9CLOT|nr:YaaR family protein [Clostridium acidisoli]SMC25941.1 hypothetical protein SAMN02745134_02631 [Clostridium acidisoli DSM 12555]
MEISRLSNSSPVTREKKQNAIKKDFSQSFNFAREQKSDEQLKQMQDKIKKRGNRLSITKCYADVKAYKSMIKEYLTSVLQNMYSVKKDVSFWQTQYFITVDVIDNKLDELTKMLLSDEKEKINVAATIDEISGLIVDIYK